MVGTGTITAPRNDEQLVTLNLLGGFQLRVGERSVNLPRHSRRVLAYLSLDRVHGHACERGVLSERLWPDVDGDRSRASLRTSLWRIRQASPRLVIATADHILLAPEVEVDVTRLRRHADRMLDSSEEPAPEAARMLLAAAELLPGWDEAWLVLAREQLRQTRLHALEASAAQLRRLGRHREAIEVMLAVIAEEPLRESAHAALIDVHISEGNTAEAHRQFAAFAELLWGDLRLRPTPELFRRVGVAYPEATPAGSPRGGRASLLARARPA